MRVIEGKRRQRFKNPARRLGESFSASNSSYRFNFSGGIRQLTRVMFTGLAIIFAVVTVAVLVAFKRIRNPWLTLLAIPLLAVLWYGVMLCFWMGYYMYNIRGVRG